MRSLNGVKLYGRVMSVCESTMRCINPPMNDDKSNLTVDFQDGVKVPFRFRPEHVNGQRWDPSELGTPSPYLLVHPLPQQVRSHPCL